MPSAQTVWTMQQGLISMQSMHHAWPMHGILACTRATCSTKCNVTDLPARSLPAGGLALVLVPVPMVTAASCGCTPIPQPTAPVTAVASSSRAQGAWVLGCCSVHAGECAVLS
jgi:hypothetical protein